MGIDFVQCRLQPRSGKIDKAPCSLSDQALRRIDDAHGGWIRFEVTKYRNERSISQMWCRLVGIEPRYAATISCCFSCSIRRIDGDLGMNSEAIV